MKLGRLAGGPHIGLIVLLSQAVTVNAAEIKVLSTHAALEALSELGPQFERAPDTSCHSATIQRI
jgi:hypothetical protein